MGVAITSTRQTATGELFVGKDFAAIDNTANLRQATAYRKLGR